MPEFRYIAVNEEGEELRGNITARAKQEAMQALHDLSLKAVEVTEVTPEPLAMPVSATRTAMKKSAPASSDASTGAAPADTPSRRYAPLSSTIRLYAGWLLAWYALVIALGYYTFVRELPFDIPFVGALFFSPLVFSFLLATFLYLLFSSLHAFFKGAALLGALMGIVGIGMFFAVRTQF